MQGPLTLPAPTWVWGLGTARPPSWWEMSVWRPVCSAPCAAHGLPLLQHTCQRRPHCLPPEFRPDPDAAQDTWSKPSRTPEWPQPAPELGQRQARGRVPLTPSSQAPSPRAVPTSCLAPARLWAGVRVVKVMALVPEGLLVTRASCQPCLRFLSTKWAWVLASPLRAKGLWADPAAPGPAWRPGPSPADGP